MDRRDSERGGARRGCVGSLLVLVVLAAGAVALARLPGPRAGERVVPPTTGSTTTESTTTVTSAGEPAPGSVGAATVLERIPVRKEQPAGYRRELFPQWLDVDGDGCDTRNQVLRRDSITPAQVDPVGCQVVAGDWRSPYDGATWESPADVDIDHVVALKEAWDSGAHAWDEARRIAYANDTTDRRTLVVATDSVNQSKGDKDPSNWLPPRPADRCRFVGDWIAIKARWELAMDQSEWGRLRNLLRDECAALTIARWPAPAR